MKLYHVPIRKTEIVKVSAHTAQQASDLAEIMMIQGMYSPCPKIIDYEVCLPSVSEASSILNHKEACYEG